MEPWCEYLSLDENDVLESEDIDVSSFDDLPVVIGTEIAPFNPRDPWANIPTETYMVPPELLALCRENI